MAAVRIPPRLAFSSILQQSPINFFRWHSPSHSGCGCGGGTSARAMSSSSSGASSPDPYTTLAERATFEREIKKSKFIAIASPVSDEHSAMSFLSQVRDPRATHNCWAYKLGEQYRSNDDGEPSGTAGKPIYSAIVSSGLDMVMVVVIRYFGGIKLGTGGLVRAYGGVALECLKGAPTCYVKPKVRVGMEVPFELVGTIYHQLQHFHAEDIKQDYDTGNDGTTMVTFKVDYEKVKNLEDAINSSCSRKIEFFKG
ncbi:IMPACT family member in pol 5'region [Carex littledalei]|uniref:IMPACT family member in pol 5'region n=1 Tax=Carex littledalei TaxID=544730 RepID=A0A833RPB7_9POAL|nr:IMPACT family member in pol 5'region [Carex littledalei]